MCPLSAQRGFSSPVAFVDAKASATNTAGKGAFPVDPTHLWMSGISNTEGRESHWKRKEKTDPEPASSRRTLYYNPVTVKGYPGFKARSPNLATKGTEKNCQEWMGTQKCGFGFPTVVAV